MEYIFNHSNKVKGTEVLFFQDAQIEKVKGSSTSFASIGTLSVLYFNDYNRYVLQINDWKYPLLRRLPIIAADKNELAHRTYILPALNGFTFILKLNKIPNVQALANFESVLTNNSNFSYKGLEMPYRKIESSPDDKLMRHKPQETSIFDIISETVKFGVEKMKVAAETFTAGTKNINNKKKIVYLKDIKNKNYRKTAHSTLNKNFFESHEKMTQDFLKMRRENINLIQARGIEDINQVSPAPEFFIAKEDIEEAILNNKDLATSGKFVMLMKSGETKSLADYLKQGFIEASLTLGEPVIRTAPVEGQKLPAFENMIHYQG